MSSNSASASASASALAFERFKVAFAVLVQLKIQIKDVIIEKKRDGSWWIAGNESHAQLPSSVFSLLKDIHLHVGYGLLVGQFGLYESPDGLGSALVNRIEKDRYYIAVDTTRA